MTRRSVKEVRSEVYAKMHDVFDRQKEKNGIDNAMRFLKLIEDVTMQILMEEEEKQ